MNDHYLAFANSALGRALVEGLGLPRPPVLERYTAGQPAFSVGDSLIGMAPGGRLCEQAGHILAAQNQTVWILDQDPARAAIATCELQAQILRTESMEGTRLKTVVFDASGIADSAQLQELHRFFHPIIRQIAECGRIVILGQTPEQLDDAAARTAQRALEGFTRSLGKEIRKGATAQLIYVGIGAEKQMESSLRFFLSPKSAYVSGQVVRIHASNHLAAVDWRTPLAGKVALVTGASRGIGAAIAHTLARDGAHVICLDVPQAEKELRAVAEAVHGSAMMLNICDAKAPQQIAAQVMSQHQGLDIIVHNAGITRDKTLGRMNRDLWNMVIDVNLASEERINDALLAAGALRHNARIICVSSISGIAGNLGQTNYATSKAGVIGMVQSHAQAYAEQGITINAVAPGFIETAMTAAIPFAIREAGRRMNSMSQGGLPVDVAEAIAWFANPASGGLQGNVVRVCGQSLLGA